MRAYSDSTPRFMTCGTGLGRDNDLDHTDRDKLLPLLCKDPNWRVEIHVGTELDYSGYGIGRFPDLHESWAILAERAPNPSKVTKLDLR